ncbi:MAG: triose-phosphate isomerase [Clostridia bacterium]|nr:triose-phosphate isomerase [Clostridia bacterium]
MRLLFIVTGRRGAVPYKKQIPTATQTKNAQTRRAGACSCRFATPEQAEETCGVIRKTLAALYGEEVAESVTIQYGGSMNEKNAAELLAKPNVDGGLIGGASLVAEKFKAIVDAAQ